jgi:hypothetical protein
MLKKCELCSAEQPAPNGLLCTACREAIFRLLTIREAARNQSDPLEEIVMYPERTKVTREAGFSKRLG